MSNNVATVTEALRMGGEFELLIKYDGPLKAADGKTPWKDYVAAEYAPVKSAMDQYKSLINSKPDPKSYTPQEKAIYDRGVGDEPLCQREYRKKMAGELRRPGEWQWKCSEVAAFITDKWNQNKGKKVIPLQMLNCLVPFSAKPDASITDLKPDYTQWSITRDYAITCPTDRYGDLFAFEIISPVMEPSSKSVQKQGYAVQVLYELFNFLTSKDDGCCGLEIYASSISTSTHFHVSPPMGYEWDTESVKRIMSSAYYWDPCVRYLLPAWRRLRDYAPDTRTEPKGALLYPKPDEPFRDKRFVAGRFALSEWDDPTKPPPYLKLTKSDIQSNLDQYYVTFKTISEMVTYQKKKVFKMTGWNLMNLQTPTPAVKALGTVEFRRPPASMSWSDAICWLDFTYAFIRAACDKGTPSQLMNTWPPTMETFQQWLQPYRLDTSLGAAPILDSKFKRALTYRSQLRLYLTPEEDSALIKAREEYSKSGTLQTMPVPDISPAEAADQTLSKCAQELIDSRGKEIAYLIEYRDQYSALLKSRVTEEILKSITVPLF